MSANSTALAAYGAEPVIAPRSARRGEAKKIVTITET